VRKGDLVFHEFWGKGMIVQQQGVVDRWLVRWFEPCGSTKGRWDVVGVWGSKLEVISSTESLNKS